MTQKPFSWDDVFEEVAAENRAAFDASDTPEQRAAADAKKLAEHEKGVRLGWWDAQGNPIPGSDDDDEDGDRADEEDGSDD